MDEVQTLIAQIKATTPIAQQDKLAWDMNDTDQENFAYKMMAYFGSRRMSAIADSWEESQDHTGKFPWIKDFGTQLRPSFWVSPNQDSYHG